MEKSLIEAGYRLIPLRDNQKRPLNDKWGENKYSLDDLGQQVGLVIERGMVDIDLDWPELRQLATDGEYDTMAWGRKGEVTHLVYRADLPEPITFKLPNVSGAPILEGDHAYTVCELRTSAEGEAYQAMIPSSIHPDGDQLEWINQVVPQEGSVDAIVKAFGLYAGVAVLSRFYPGEGSRDEFALALTGCMVRAGWPEESVQRFMTYLCQLTGDNEVKMRSDKARRALKRLEAGKKVAGIPKAADLMGIPIEWMQEIAVWLGWKKRNPKGKGSAVFVSGVVRDVSMQAWDALAEYQVDGDPGVYTFGEALARVDGGRMQLLDGMGLRFELNRCASWLGWTDGKWTQTSTPKSCVEDMLSARRRDVTVPELKQVSIVPTFTRSGRLLNENGFDEESGIFLDLHVSVDIPTEPTRKQVWSALRQLWTPISQFPFEDKSDKAHALAMILEPYMRDMFGPTPFYFINKPAAGTGASLFIETALFPTLGDWPKAQTPPRSDEEMKKTLTASFIDGMRCIFLDNAKHLDSGELASAMTAEVYAARILGVSKMLNVPVKVQWVGSGNNTLFSVELYRRVVDIRMNAKMSNPEDRHVSQFKIKNLKTWVRDNQAEQVKAALTIIQYWVNQGMPAGSGSKASYEDWASKMSGLLETTGVRGFLETPIERRPEDAEADEARELVLAMWEAQRGKSNPSDRRFDEDEGWRNATDWSKPVKASDIAQLVVAGVVSLDFGFKDPARAVGELMRQQMDVPLAFETETGKTITLTVRKSRYQGTTRWHVEKETAD